MYKLLVPFWFTVGVVAGIIGVTRAKIEVWWEFRDPERRKKVIEIMRLNGDIE
jgi:hypothetical protein